MKSYYKQIEAVEDILNTDEAKIIDQDLINLLSVEDDCSKLENLTSTNEHFEKLIERHEIDENDLLRRNNLAAKKKKINSVILSDINEEEIGELITKEFGNNETTNDLRNIMTESDVDDILNVPNLSVINNIEIDLDMGLKLLEDELKCPYCQKEYKTKKLLTYHIMSHTNDKKWSCDICQKRFKHRYEVAVHKRTHLEPSFECEICSKKFTQNSHLTTHKKRHFSDYTEYCTPCKRGFYSRSQYKNHINVAHKQIWHICEICGCKLSTKSALKDHMATHDQRTRTAICEICGKTYLNSRNLRNHLKTHSQDGGFSCKVCGKLVSGKKTLEEHVRTHSGEKPIHCSICDKSFASKSYLKAHLRTHTGIKPYCCAFCRKSFTQRSSLKIHVRYHTGERPYVCSTCGKGFVNRTHLNGHVKTHDFSNKIDESNVFNEQFV